MRRPFLSILTALAFGSIALGATSGYAQAGSSNDYRLIGCKEVEPGVPPTPPPAYDVIFSSSPEDIGLPCETVLTSLGNQGFRLIEVRTDDVFNIGDLHYLQRSKASPQPVAE